MIKLCILAASLAASYGAAQASSTRAITLQDLTVPAERLPSGCALAPAGSQQRDGKTVLSASWAGLPIPTNPWVGTDRVIVVAIRQRMVGPLAVPDGPPPTKSENARFYAHLADGVDEAYAAVYQQPDSTVLVVVYGARFTDVSKSAEVVADQLSSRTAPRVIRLAAGGIAAVISGSGPCVQSIDAYLKSLPK